MTKSAALLSSVALLCLATAYGGCGSNAASSAPNATGSATGTGPGTGTGASNGTAGTGASGPDVNPFGNSATQGSGGDTSGSAGGSTGQSGNGSGATGNDGGTNGTGAVNTGATGTSGAGPSGGSNTVDPGAGGTGTTIDQSGGQGTTIDQSGGQGTTVDQSGGQGTTVDLTGGKSTTVDLFGGTGNTSDMTGGVGTPPPPPPKDAGSPGCIPTWFGKQINVLVLHDAYIGGADTRGGLWVGGNLKATGGYDVGGDLPPDPSCTRYDLAVGGNINLGGYLVLHNGAAAYGGTLSPPSVSGAVCGIFKNPANMPNFTQIATEVKANSAYFAGLPANGKVNGTILDGSNASCKIVVFNTSLCTFDYNVIIKIPANGTAIINSTCTNPSFSSGPPSVVMGGVAQPICNGQVGTGGSCDRVLYNFPNATTVTVNATVQGSILAPYAKFLGQGGNMDGLLVVDQLGDATNLNVTEFHAWFFEGCLDTTTC
jgi:choice-of-anchor A domain-containing protein